eukprot:6312604-Alexandrium_andersonii.AAC.1
MEDATGCAGDERAWARAGEGSDADASDALSERRGPERFFIDTDPVSGRDGGGDGEGGAGSRTPQGGEAQGGGSLDGAIVGLMQDLLIT